MGDGTQLCPSNGSREGAQVRLLAIHTWKGTPTAEPIGAVTGPGPTPAAWPRSGR
jgi:hypothetical protein